MLIGLAGDVLVDRDDPQHVFSEVRDLLGSHDILFANLESPYSDSPELVLTSGAVIVPAARNLDVYEECGFHVVSMANNHIIDAGHAAMLETRSRLRRQGVATCGAGENLAAAREAAVLTRDNRKFGFLAYASVFPHGYEARSGMPGLAPLRAYNHYHEELHFYAPGRQPRIETIPDVQDHQNLQTDIDALRPDVDLLAVSFHWGDHLQKFVVGDHERRTARFCIDRGVDLVIGHHHHTIRGIEWYRGRPVFYGLGHFVFDTNIRLTDELRSYFDTVDPDSYAVLPRDGWPLLPFHPDARMTMLAWVREDSGSVVDVGFVPCRLSPDGLVHAVDPDSDEGRQVISYFNHCNSSQKLNGVVTTEGAPVIAGHQSVRVLPVNRQL